MSTSTVPWSCSHPNIYFLIFFLSKGAELSQVRPPFSNHLEKGLWTMTNCIGVIFQYLYIRMHERKSFWRGKQGGDNVCVTKSFRCVLTAVKDGKRRPWEKNKTLTWCRVPHEHVCTSTLLSCQIALKKCGKTKLKKVATVGKTGRRNSQRPQQINCTAVWVRGLTHDKVT